MSIVPYFELWHIKTTPNVTIQQLVNVPLSACLSVYIIITKFCEWMMKT
jgi:hypothetical protein